MLSHNWRVTLKKLEEFGERGVSERVLCELVGGEDVGRRNLARVALDQMFFKDMDYWEPIGDGHIRITDKGREALK